MRVARGVFDRLLDESYEKCELHPLLKRLVLRAAESALHQVTPDNYYHKCHGAALATFMILRTLRIRSLICTGTVSWLFGGIGRDGSEWQSTCGFWAPNPGLPSPHVWLRTEFGSHIDLTCSYFHMTMGEMTQRSSKHDMIPKIWIKSEHLAALPCLKYTTAGEFSAVDLENCDDMARKLVETALRRFWADPIVDKLLKPGAEPTVPSWNQDSAGDILDGPQTLELLRQRNSWVARNSRLHSLLEAPPIANGVG